ncbi:FtsX-like permease family protein [Micromonospora saelicesensis]|uniref:Putative ABC transport system permease protein n=1 Tax=Micromonospora saelicesensis TaxID=285676 RepID=A0A1C4X2D8_9ACTN|nr:FtsX-like permease family protein [Micromonospora saelicesensis]SCF02620.1 putative ABC transport system permease protein [Micromonospora saelicesensis]
MTIRRPTRAPGRADTATPRPAAPPAPVGRRRFAELTGSWRAALRIARRESRRSRRRTALVLAMIAMPVAALAFLAASYDMAELTPQERVERRLGVADAQLQWIAGAPVGQDEWGESWYTTADGKPPSKVSAAQLTALLGPGSRVTEVRPRVPLTLRGPHRDEVVNARVLDLTDPLARGLVRFRAGRAPQQPGEVAVSPVALRRLDLRLGHAVAAADGSRAYTVVAVVEFPDDLGPVVALHPGAAPSTGPEPDSVWLADVPGTVDAALVSRLNDRGVVVTARHIGSATGADRTWLGSIMGDNPNDLSTGVLIAGLGLLEVVLLVGPAFAVGVRRRRRDLALVAVAGGDAAQLRRVVLADGVVLGVLGAAAGLLVGVGAAFAGRPLMEQYVFSARFGGYRCWPSALVLLGGVAVLAGVLAALAPAWTAARQDVSAGLAGRRTPAKSPGRWLALGLALVVGGAGLAAFGATRTSPAVVLTGLILGELGLVCCTPTLLGVLARLGRVLPLAPRIALRDASRNRAAAAPAICAVMAAVASSVALGGYLASDGARDARAYRPALPTGHVMVNPIGAAPQPTLAQITDAARNHLGVGAVAPVQTPSCGAGRTGYCDIAPVLPLARACPWQPGVQLPAAQRQQARADPRCQVREADYFGGYVEPGVDDGTALPLLTGVDPATTAAATAVLRAGGVVVTDPRYLHDGLVTVRVTEVEAGPDVPITAHDLPGYALPRAIGQSRLLLSADAARQLGLSWSQTGWVIGTTTPPDEEQQARFAAALRPFGTLSLGVEYGGAPRDVSPLLLLLAAAAGLITVGAAGIATALAAAEGRAELTTLAAVGAAPAVRRLLAICQAGVIAGLGSVLGIVAGLGTAAIVLVSVNRQYASAWPVSDPYPFLVPWPALGVLVLVPVVAMLGAGLFTRARLPIERRLD